MSLNRIFACQAQSYIAALAGLYIQVRCLYKEKNSSIYSQSVTKLAQGI